MTLYENAGPDILEIYTDGASRRNPGPAAFAFLFVKNGEITFEASEYLGEATNNTAEYRAVIAALQKAGDITQGPVRICSDSELVVRQIRGAYRINQPHLQELRSEVATLEKQFSRIEFRNVPRENRFIQRCDALCNETLDRHR